jgi:LemA protein
MTMMTTPLLLFGLLIVLGLWAMLTYNRLVGLRNQTLNGWSQIDVQLKRRHDLIPNLVSTVKGAMEFEQTTLTMVIEARNKAVGASGPADAAQKEGMLTQALGKLFALAESYPALKSNDNVRMLQEELATTENKIGFARQFYNDVVMRFNTAQQTFPANLLASSFGFKPAELFELADAGERAVPTVDLSIKK